MNRTFLYVPANRPDRVKRAMSSGPDAVIMDLEDAVPLREKSRAREVVLEELLSTSTAGPRPELWVRINAGDVGREDLAALSSHIGQLDGALLAKCEDPDWLEEVAAAIPEPVTLSPLIESALAMERLNALCAHPRVEQCQLGEIDLLADLGARRADAEVLLAYARTHLLFASAAASLAPPIAGVYPEVRDLEGLAEDSMGLAGLGFGGRPALHPNQVPVIESAFIPSAEEIASAQRLVALYDKAQERGAGAVCDEEGRMVDEAVVRRARRLLVGGFPGPAGAERMMP